MSPPGGRHAGALICVLLLQAAAYYLGVPVEQVPLRQALTGFPERVAEWRMASDFPLDAATREVLRAHDTLNRVYVNAEGSEVNLFVAYFESQRGGQAPHSPKHCLPGAGFEPSVSGTQDISVPGRTIQVNRFVVTRGEERKVVLYWYQSRDRVVASEYMAKIRLVLDSIRYHRSDTALVRVTVPAYGARDDIATQVGADFIRCVFPNLSAFLPS